MTGTTDLTRRLADPVAHAPECGQGLGHASIATTNIYLHHLGSSADRAGLERLNRPGGAGVRTGGSVANDEDETPPGA